MKFSVLVYLLAFIFTFSAHSQLLMDATTIQDIQKSHIDANLPPIEKHEMLIKDEIRRYLKLSKTEKLKIESELLRTQPTQSGISYPKFYRWVKVIKNKWPIIAGAIRYSLIEKKKAEISDFVDSHFILNDPSISLKVFPPEVHKRAVTKAQAMKQIQDKCSDGKKFERISKYPMSDGYLLGSDKGEWTGELEYHPKDRPKYQIINKNIKAILKLNNRVFILNGLGHLSIDEGEINELKLQNGKWHVLKIIKLPGEPTAFDNTADSSIRISTRKGIVVFKPDQALEYVDCNF